MEDTEKNQEVQEDPSPCGLGGASRLEDGGPAFPRPYSRQPQHYEDPDVYPAEEGMSLRDYFAAKAISGMLSDSENSYSCTRDETHWTQAFARVAYQMADAMIAARKAGSA